MSICATIKSDDGKRRGIVIGLEEENVRQLRAGQPFLLKLDRYGFPDVEVVIVLAETQDDLAKMFLPFIGPETRVERRGE